MRFKLPGSRVHVRLFERVETSNDTYDIFDVGVDSQMAMTSKRSIALLSVDRSPLPRLPSRSLMRSKQLEFF